MPRPRCKAPLPPTHPSHSELEEGEIPEPVTPKDASRKAGKATRRVKNSKPYSRPQPASQSSKKAKKMSAQEEGKEKDAIKKPA
ncbi:hypothetical protein BD410DRAFT_847235 [Rickenella mellea]|uniref:Uncharacterized protein n=1 Tax=Rickenella mellea TaxID=50990 RepID=A0A4Y7PEE0_9AGAM|nr:hypothetical protein BD410DRAFT_847235 [Rickenella mellea]